jgi:DNA-binding MarR family transcriptional regulator
MRKTSPAAVEQRRRAPSADNPEKRVEQLTGVTREREPLRRRILAELAEGPATPTQLSKSLGSAPPSISRVLKDFRTAGFVIREEDGIDHRNRHYYLTEVGEVELNRETAFGEKQDPPADRSQDEKARLLWKALEKGVRIRREQNRLDEAASRFRAVIREAEKLGERELALQAMVELAKTVRQDRRSDEQPELNATYEELVRRLNGIAIGDADGYDADHALPAAAHLRYVLGRSGDRRDDDLQTREAHLISARELYGQLYLNSDRGGGREWFTRRAWSMISLAGNLRKQTLLEPALRTATVAKHDFDLLEDDYGRAHCLFMFGLCLRLLGEFHEAAACLERAHGFAVGNSFERIRADALMQMGEVKRCLGELEEARTMLDEALDHAGRMDLWVTQAFARSALGAVDFQTNQFDAARESFEAAGRLFEGCQHDEGIALNTRRQAAVARRSRASEEGSRPSYAAIEQLIRTASEGYSKLQSPAGIVACEVEEGWVRMLRKGGRVQAVVGRLQAILDDRGKREFLELDPWVPQLLCRFAGEAQDEDLLSESETVMATAQEKLRERGMRGVDQVAEVVGEIKHEDERELDAPTVEMGGESRRDLGASSEASRRVRETEHEFALAR